ncbi:hypothetical protein [Alteromonas flava]|uniref:hypothetical protein n=1 Tax=Alteromonas flava TaxID=2048003 RepID=UPI000C28D388|nr:hypothetical protein [Alteromonas flava]
MNIGHHALQIPSQPFIQLSPLDSAAVETTTASFAHLSPQQRTSEIQQWLSQNSNRSFVGTVNFGKNLRAGNCVSNMTSLLVCENSDWQVTVVHSPSQPFATQVISKFRAVSLSSLDASQVNSLGHIMTVLSTRYDNLCMSTVPLNIEWSESYEDNCLIAVITPNIQAQSGLFAGQRFIGADFSAQQVARRLGNLSDIHFRDIFTMD